MSCGTPHAAKDVFKTWAEDFVRWIRLESDPLATALERAAEREDVIGMATDDHAPDIRFIWLHLKKLMVDTESKEIVRTTIQDNGMEAWRRFCKANEKKGASHHRPRLMRLLEAKFVYGNFAQRTDIWEKQLRDHERLGKTKLDEDLAAAIRVQAAWRGFSSQRKTKRLIAEVM